MSINRSETAGKGRLPWANFDIEDLGSFRVLKWPLMGKDQEWVFLTDGLRAAVSVHRTGVGGSI